MEANEIVIGIVIIAAIVLIVFIVTQNNKDKKKLTKFLNKNDKSTNENDPEFDKDDSY